MNDVEMEISAAVGDILILRGGGLGDTLLALPAAAAAARYFSPPSPSSPPRIEWVGNPAVLPVMPLGLAGPRLRSANGPALALLRREDADPEETVDFKGTKVAFCCPKCVKAWNKMSDADKTTKLK